MSRLVGRALHVDGGLTKILLCAWVLWVGGIDDSSRPQGTFETRAQCLVRLNEDVALHISSKLGHASTSDGYAVFLSNDPRTRHYKEVCLPDTVKP